MSRNRPALIVSLLLAIAVLSAGCVGPLGGGDNASDNPVETPTDDSPATQENQSSETADNEQPALDGEVQPDTLRLNALETMDSVETAAFTMQMEMEMSDQTIDLSSEGVMDYESQKMRMEMEMGGMVGEQSITQYVVNETMYVKAMGEWQKQDAAEMNIWERNELSQQQALLENSSVEISDTRSYQGHSVHVVNVDPDEETIQEIMASGGAGNAAGGEFGPAAQPSVSDMAVTQYIDTETNHVRYSEIVVSMETMGEEVDMTMTMTFDEFGEPVDITLPDEAEDATATGSDVA